MKKIYKQIAILFAVILTIAFVGPHSIEAKTLKLKAESAILVDADTGKILYSKNPDVSLPPASMTKMMTEYLVLEAIDNGEINWDSTTQISDYAYSISANPSFSGIGLTQDKDYTVEDLYHAMAINSDNAATIALAELIAGSEGEFVKMMNKKAEEMGLTEFEFVNSSGLDNESLGKNHPEGTDPKGVNLLSARSAALLAYHLINDYPEALEISSIPETEFDGKTITNWNWMLPHNSVNFKQFYYEGIDGLKTGYTDLAGFCFTGTAERNGKRLISVVMKTDSEATRFKETIKLMDYGYNNFEDVELFPKGYQIKGKSTLSVIKGKEKTVDIETKDAITIPIKKGTEDKYSLTYKLDKKKLTDSGELEAPIKKGEKIGTAELVYDGEDLGYIIDSDKQHVDVITKDSVEKSNWFMLILRSIGEFFSNLFSSMIDMIKGWFN